MRSKISFKSHIIVYELLIVECMDYHISLNISDISLMFLQITVFLLISIIVHVLPHGLLMWLGIW